MSDVLLLVGKLAFASIGVAVGFKLAGEARGRGTPGLHTVALAAICIGGIGLIAMPAARPLESTALVWLAEIAVRVAMLLLCVFVAGTFRPTPGGVTFAVACGAFLIATLVWDVTSQPLLLAYDYTRASSHANQLSVALPFAWSVAESLRLWRRSRRQLALGLCDAVVVRRYLLWSCATGSFVAICLLAIAAGLAAASGASGLAAAAHGLRGVLYLAITGCVWHALFRATESGRVASPALND